MSKENPLHVDVLGQLDQTLYEADFQDLVRRIDTDDGARTEWITRCKEVRDLIDCEDKRSRKPWPNASDTAVPMLKRSLRRWKPNLFNLVWQADPVCAFWAGNPDAMKAAPDYEQFFTWLVKYDMQGVAQELQLLLENMGGDRGTGYLVVSWDHRTELCSRVVDATKIVPPGKDADVNTVVQTVIQEYKLDPKNPDQLNAAIDVATKIVGGARFVRLTYQRLLSNRPKLTSFDPFDVIVPVDCSSSHGAEYVCLRHRLTVPQLRALGADGVLDKARVEAAIELLGVTQDAVSGDTSGGAGTGVQTARNHLANRRGINYTGKQYNLDIHQVFCRIDYNGDGIKERCVLWYEPTKKTVLAALPYAYPFDHWPVFRFDFEIISRAPYISRGIGHIFKDLQAHLNKQYRARSDAIDITLAPMFFQRTTSFMRGRKVVWGPGKVIEVQSGDDFGEIPRNTWNLQQYLQSEQEIQGYVDQTLGNVTSDLAASGRRLERRSGAEATAVTAAVREINNMEAVNFQEVMKLVWQAVWDLWLELGPTDEFFFVQGQAEPGFIRRSDIGAKYQLIPAGTPGNVDRVQQLQMGMQLLDIAFKDPTRQFNLAELYRYVTTRLDLNLAKVALLSPAQQQDAMVLQQAAASIAANGIVTPVAGATGGGPA